MAESPMGKGAPKGSRNKAKGTEWSDQLRWALANYTNAESGIARGQALRAIAEKVVEQAVGGEWKAIEEIGNRLDGKPAQTIDLMAEVRTRVEELSDAELADIALGRSDGVAEAASGAEVDPSVH